MTRLCVLCLGCLLAGMVMVASARAEEPDPAQTRVTISLDNVAIRQALNMLFRGRPARWLDA